MTGLPIFTPKQFQFQYGAIKREIVTSDGNVPDPFQFQYGAIKRYIAIKTPIYRKSFNSNMVRLKVQQDTSLWEVDAKFQFQYGAIKSVQNFIHRYMCLLFQFQYGAIKSLRPILIRCILYLFQFQYGAIKSSERSFEKSGAIFCFNSNMVRLKAGKSMRMEFIQNRFNSNMVRLKEMTGLLQKNIYLSFNSNMVRLKGGWVAQRRRYQDVSIPIWCD